jgi:hypothetical protein
MKTEIVVFFESPLHAEEVAHFSDESLYLACLPALEAKAKELRMVVTESMREEEDLNEYANEAFYRWEKKLFGEETPLSDNDRNLFVTGYVVANTGY